MEERGEEAGACVSQSGSGSGGDGVDWVSVIVLCGVGRPADEMNGADDLCVSLTFFVAWYWFGIFG